MLIDFVVPIAKFLGDRPMDYYALKTTGVACDKALRRQFSSFLWTTQIVRKWSLLAMLGKATRAQLQREARDQLREMEESFEPYTSAWVRARDQEHPRCRLCHAEASTFEGYCMHCSR